MLHGEGTTPQEEDEGRKSIQPGRLTQGPTKASFHNNFQHQCHHRYPHHHHHHHHNVGCHLATDGGKNSVVDVEGVRRQDQGPKTLQVNMSVRKDVPEKNDIFGHCPKLPLPLPCTKFGQLFHFLKSVKMNLGRGSPPIWARPKNVCLLGRLP